MKDKRHGGRQVVLEGRPASFFEKEEDGQRSGARRAGRYSSEDLHRALFEEAPEPRTLDELKEGVRQYVRGRHARR